MDGTVCTCHLHFSKHFLYLKLIPAVVPVCKWQKSRHPMADGEGCRWRILQLANVAELLLVANARYGKHGRWQMSWHPTYGNRAKVWQPLAKTNLCCDPLLYASSSVCCLLNQVSKTICYAEIGVGGGLTHLTPDFRFP